MKKIIILPALLVASLTLWSFTPDGSSGADTQVITLSDGTVIIPSGVNMTTTDQTNIAYLLNSAGTDYGYFNYQTSTGVQSYNAPLDASALSSIDTDYGTDLASGNAGSGVLIYKHTICLTRVSQVSAKSSLETSDLEQDLAPILSNYGY